MKVTVNGILNKVYSPEMKMRDMWEEVYRKFGKENISMTPSEFYIEDRFALFIDLRSMKENALHGSGLRLGINRRSISESGEVKCHIFIVRYSVQNCQSRACIESVKILQKK